MQTFLFFVKQRCKEAIKEFCAPYYISTLIGIIILVGVLVFHYFY